MIRALLDILYEIDLINKTEQETVDVRFERSRFRV